MNHERTKPAEYKRRYRKTPTGAAGHAWDRLTARSGAKYNHRRCYSRVQVRMTRAEFMAWAVPAYTNWFATRPNETPSVDRIDSTRNYEIGNLQLIEVQANRSKNSRHRNQNAPEGKWWCCDCQDYLPVTDFYTCKSEVTAANPNGHPCYCKPCMKRKAKEQTARNKDSG